MTCMLLSPWQLFIQPHGWSPMDPGLPLQLPSDFRKHHRSYGASESESPQASNDSGKRRPSRAGTRSVSTLSAAQLERKRANDRDAQRAIRQRTKDHIDGLEKTINDLRIAQEASEKLLVATQQQNREILEENAYLRSKLGEAGITVNVALHEHPNRLEAAPFALHSNPAAAQIPGSSNQSDDIASTPRSALSLTTSQSSDSQQSSWQTSQSNVLHSAPGNLPTGAMIQASSNVANWRPHDSLQNTQSTRVQIQDPPQNPSHLSYGTNVVNQDVQWEAARQSHLYHGQQPHPPSASNMQQQQNLQYGSTVVPVYEAQSNPQQASYQPPVPPQAEFQSMTVASPVGYRMAEQHQGFANRTQYAMAPTEVTPSSHNSDFAPQVAQMQSLLPLGQPYPPTQGDEQYSMQHSQSMPNHAYPPTSYPGR